MISNPKPGQPVQVWYGQKSRTRMPFHGRVGVVEVAGNGKPRNHLIAIDGRMVVIPAGNLREPKR